MRRRTIAILIVLALPLALALYSFLEARRMPVVREATIGLPNWPAGAKPVTAVLISDIHIGSASMGAGRLEAIVASINALHPDLVLIAGDFVNGHDSATVARFADGLSGALSQLRPRLGTVAVLGNHDASAPSAVRTVLEQAHVTILSNQAIARGPIAIAGIDYQSAGQWGIDQSWKQLQDVPGARIAISHSPDIDRALPKDASLLLAGHSHCGQVLIPFYGPVAPVTRDPERCGLIREEGLTLIVTAGLGTSGGPFRLGAPPDLWLLHLGPAARARKALTD